MSALIPSGGNCAFVFLRLFIRRAYPPPEAPPEELTRHVCAHTLRRELRFCLFEVVYSTRIPTSGGANSTHLRS
jgi:hypothetical protein